MPAIVLTLLQGLLLLLLYVFIGRAVRAVVRDLTASTSGPRRSAAARPAPPPRQERPAKARITPGQLVVHTPDGRPEVIDLRGSTIVFGRSPDAVVRLNDPYTSDRHAKVHREGKDWLITDLGSTNGTFVNQVKISGSTPIAAGDQLGIGRTVVEVRK